MTSVLDSVVLMGRTMDARVAEAITGVQTSSAIDQAATVTLDLHDPRRTFVRSKIATERITLAFEGHPYVLVQVAKDGYDLTLTFEDQYVNALRQVKGTLAMARSKITRAGFARRLALDPLASTYLPGRQALAFWSPEFAPRTGRVGKTSTGKPLPPGQPNVKTNAATSTKVVPDTSPDGVSFTPGARLTCSDAVADANQRENMAICLGVAQGLGASQLVTLAMVETIIVESNARNLTGGDLDSVGLFQQRPKAGWTGLRNREEATRQFLLGKPGMQGAISYAASHPGASAGHVAQAIQVSAYPDRYDQHQAEAQRWCDAWRGTVVPSSSGGASGPAAGYQFSRGADETSWDAIARLADELQWRAFVADGTVYFAPDSALLNQPVALRLSEDDDGVDTIGFDQDAGKPASTATITAHVTTGREVRPGQVVVLRDLGPADGNWIVESVTRDWFALTVDVGLTRPRKALPEPPESGGSTSTSGSSKGAQAVSWGEQWAVGLTYKGQRAYLMGAHHGLSPAQTSQQTPPFDCSSFVRGAWGSVGVDVGNVTGDQIAKARAAGIPHGSGVPTGGWQAGDLYFPHAEHVVLMTGRGSGALEAKGHDYGIIRSTRSSPAYFWARWGGS